MRQRRWLVLIKDYDLEVHYHPRKANVLSRKAHCHCKVAKTFGGYVVSDAGKVKYGNSPTWHSATSTSRVHSPIENYRCSEGRSWHEAYLREVGSRQGNLFQRR